MTDEELELALGGEQSQPVEQEEQQPEPIAEQQEATEPIEEQQEVEPVEKEEEDKAQAGLLKEVAKQREKRRALEARLTFLEGQMAAKQEPAKEPEAPTLGVADDELVDGKVVNGLHGQVLELQTRLDAQQKAFEARVRADTERKINKTQEQARKDYSAEKVGTQYEYDKVVSEGFIPLIQNDPALAQRVRESENPAMEAYRVGLLNLHDPLDILNKKPVAPKPPAKPAPKTLGTAPAGGGAQQGQDLGNLSREQIGKLSDKQLEELIRKTK